jgi:uncharacterized small protein (DUF1192 family)
MTDDLVKRLREGRTKGSNLEWRVTAVHLEAAARIAELEAEVARLKAGVDQLGRMWEANQDLLAESKEIDFQFDEVKRLTAENARLREVRLIAESLEAWAQCARDGRPIDPSVVGLTDMARTLRAIADDSAQKGDAP